MKLRNTEVSKDSTNEIIINSENNFKKFQTNITKEKIYLLNQELKKHDKKGFVSYFYFIQSMKNVFDNINDNQNNINNIESISQDLSLNLNKNSSSFSYDDIYSLFFKRFREVKCLLKNNKEVFYLTDFKNENYISIYKVLCALIIFLLAKFDVKLELLFRFSDIDDDGLLNKKEIKHMITTVNHLFAEETNSLKMNSSILLQSLTNIKVENILKELLEGQGDLNNELIKNGNYIDYNTFYQGVIKIKNYKYKIIPCFINIKECLFNKKKENIIKIKSKHKNDFINISSSFMAEQCKSINNYKFRKKYVKMDISDIIKPMKYEEKNNEKIFMKTNMNLKSLMKNYSTILDNNNTNYNLNDNESERYNSTNFRNTKYAFQANYFDIRNIEVEPGIIQIIPNEEKKEENYNSTMLNSKEFFTSRKDIKNIINTNNNSNIEKDSLKSNKKFTKKNLLPYNNKTFLRANKNKINSSSKSTLLKNRINNKQNYSRISKPSFNLDLKKKKSKIKNLMNDVKKTKIKKINNNNYKTLEEIMKEIKSQEDIFNNESINFINIEMVKESDKSEFFMKKLKNSFLRRNEKSSRSSNFYGILYRKKGNLPEIFNYKKKF